MKYIGIALVAVSLILSGLYAARLIQRRVHTLDAVLLFISLCENSLEFSLLPVAGLIRDAAQQRGTELLDFLTECSDLCERGEDFPYAWKKSVSDSRAFLNKAEREKLSQLGSCLGHSDIGGQLKLLELYRSYFSESRQTAVNTRTRYGGLLASLGVLSGILAAILLL